MDIGLLRNNTTYYDGFEGEDEVVLSLKTDPEVSIHIWVGYLDDILSNPVLNGSKWTGLTRDYHQLEGAFSEEGESAEASPEEYLNDLQQYTGRKYDEPETEEVFQLIITFLQYAIQVKSLVRIQLV